MNELQKHMYRYLLLAVVVILTVGTIFYHFVEKWSFLNSYYFSVVTLATVGYGDFTPKTDVGKIFTTFYIFSGVGLITGFFSLTMQRLKNRMEKREEKKGSASRVQGSEN